MRFLTLAALVTLPLHACSKPAAPDGLKEEMYIGTDGRSRLCVFPGGHQAAIIAFAANASTNCSASGNIIGEGDKTALRPSGEGECRIPLHVSGDKVMVGKASAACDYYCGPGVAWGGQTYNWVDNSTAETLAEPLMPTDRC